MTKKPVTTRGKKQKGREKLGEGAIRKMGKQGEIVTKPKPAEVRDTQEERDKDE